MKIPDSQSLVQTMAVKSPSSQIHNSVCLRITSYVYRRTASVLLLALCCLIPLTGHTESTDFLTAFEVEYSVGNNFVTAGTARLSLKKEGAIWIYTLTTLPSGIFKLAGKGKIEEISVLLLEGNALRPQRYSYRQDEETKRSVDAWFDWAENKLKYTRRGTDGVVDLNDRILDRLSVTLKVRERLRAGFEQLEIQTFDDGRIKNMIFENQGTETLSTELGETETIRVKSHNKDGSKRRETTTWFAPELDYVPIKIEQHKEGNLVARLTLTRLNK